MTALYTIIQSWLFFLAAAGPMAAECAPFYCSLASKEAISQSGGTINGTLTFPSGVNGTAANFNGTAYVGFTNPLFNAPSGSLSMWFKKNASDLKGGIMEIGHLGSPNSLGLFYANTGNVYFEMRNSASQYKTIFTSGVLSQAQFHHIVAIWDTRDDTIHMKLFMDGLYTGGETLAGPFVHAHGFMNLGTAGSGEWYGNGRGVVDEVRFFDWALSDGEVYAEYVYSSNRYRYQPTGKPESTGPVQVVDRRLIVDGRPFTVKGVGYQPMPIGMEPTRSTLDRIFTDPRIIERDIRVLKQMNVNTIRLWAQLSDTTLLDALTAAGIYAIMAFQVPASTDNPSIDYTNPAFIDLYTKGMRDYVNKFKGHPAVLAWAIGNENNLHYRKDVSDWYRLANTLAKAAYEAEGPAYHPTLVVNGYMLYFANVDYGSDDVSLSYVDLWGHNTYVRYDYHSYFCYYDKVTAKPLILTEFGVDAYDRDSQGEDQDAQAEWVVHEWDQIAKGCLGGAVMEYCDEWWKSGSPSAHDSGGYYTDVQPDGFSNEEWYGIMAVEKNGTAIDILRPRAIYCALQRAYADGQQATGDVNSDGRVDFNDFAGLAAHWLKADCCEVPCCDGTDLDGNGRITTKDLAMMCEQWLENSE